MGRSGLFRLSALLWATDVTVVILRNTADAFEDRTTVGVPVVLAAAALAATVCAAVREPGGQHAPRPGHRALRIVTAALWAMEAAMLVMRNTGGRHPGDYLLGYIIAIGLAAGTAAVCLAIRAADGHDKTRLIRALADASERSAPGLERHLLQASSSSLPGGR